MIRFLTLRLALTLGFSLSAVAFPHALRAQLVRETPAPPQQEVPAKDTPNTPSAQAPTGKKRLSQEVQLTGEESWTDTGVDIQAGEHALITATGKLRYGDVKEDNGPDGLPRGFKDLLRVLPFNEAGRGALIGRIGDKDIAQPFVIGARRDVLAPVSGRLSVGINQTTDGDMVNFLIIGSEDAMQRVFTTAGWVKVDADVKGTVLHGILGSLSKESYLTMPMSELYLFGRPQDYGWAHAEPISVVRSRNHLRVWKAPFQVNGETLWVGAATHDIGFERDQRNNGITHKIDPDIDLERDYVEKTLSSTGLVTDVTHFTPDNPMKEAKTATGGTFHSNGQVLILKLDESPAKP